MKKELKSSNLSADCRPTVGGVNVIAVLYVERKLIIAYLTISENSSFIEYYISYYEHIGSRANLA